MYLSQQKVLDSPGRRLKLRHYFSTGNLRSLEMTAFLSSCGPPPPLEPVAGGQFCALNHKRVQALVIVLLILFLLVNNASIHVRSNDPTRPVDSTEMSKNLAAAQQKQKQRNTEKFFKKRQKFGRAKIYF